MNLDKIKEQIFIIADIKFKVGDDLELDDSTEAVRLLNLLFSTQDKTVRADITKEDLIKFLSIVLVPVNGKRLPDNFNFGRIKKNDIPKTIISFFLKLINESANTERDCENLIKEQLVQLKSMEN